jgi:tetratricopeptide (TPR) repeat protein
MRTAVIGCLLLFFVSNLPAFDLRDPEFTKRAQSGFTAMFNMDYEEARQIFQTLEKEYPQHPAPPLYLGCILWLEEMTRRQDLSLNRFVAPDYFANKTNQVMPARERAAFFDYLQKSDALCDAILRNNSRDKDGRYFLGTIYGLRASFAITLDHSLREAYSSGTKAYSYAKQLIEEDPNYYDAYLTSGVYQYVVGSIPWYLKWMAYIIGARGSKEEGLAHLKIAAEKGQYIRNEAHLFIMILNVRDHQYDEAYKTADFLSTHFPRNFLFPMNAAQILQMAGRKEQATAIFLQVSDRVEKKVPNFDRLPSNVFRYNLGLELTKMGRTDLAQDQFLKVINDPQAQEREKAISHLQFGKILQAKGQHAEAAREFNAVLAMQDYEDSHSEAKQCLKKQPDR